MAGQSSTPLPAAAVRELTDFCRSCKKNVTGRNICVVNEWCCSCLSKLADNHTHVCEYDFGAAKQNCVSCNESNYANTGIHAKPCLGPPTGAQTVASRLIAAANHLCAVEYKFAKAQDKMERCSVNKEHENNDKVKICEQQIQGAKDTFDQAAEAWKALIRSNGRSAVKLSKARLAEDQIAGLTAADIFKKEPVASQRVNTAGSSGAQQPDIFKIRGEQCLKDLGRAETAIDEAVASLDRFYQTPGMDLSGIMGHRINKRLKAIDEAHFVLAGRVGPLKYYGLIPDYPFIGDPTNSDEEGDTGAFGLSH